VTVRDSGDEVRAFIGHYLTGLQAAVDALPRDELQAALACVERAYDAGQQVFIAGNGGSAATASHMACDLAKSTLGRSGAPRAKRFRAIALTDNVPLLTAWGNDVGYDQVFAEPLRNLGRPGDLLIVITASGNSPNILAAVGAARELGLVSLGLLGFDGGAVRGLLDHSVVVPSDNYGYIEDVHLMLNHLITAFFARRPAS
jgi:D-sedoheptulose 7-phosphate isomerase